ncbi:ScbR family autoregulator-binding transcription factor [Kitasatospora sp. NBC_00240]|uniref:ScbR family autoregulator-binding transcription factor n=1 Tax=Kitasatospora sp. NBC_00240 TaxID=2903567 RepID=UPI002257F0E1|nr:ScbR family autoregulator-binding transcription factor [Kitasatospora sp. NBC_00240]MCX5213168.1 ScbR family autoregulator-binding transcription factor [Kitasatospora sp. NBC_00240]
MAKQPRAEQTRATIIEAAAQMFDRQGFGSTSLSDIVARGGITKGALYFHFASKEELARAVIALQHQLSVNAAERLLSRNLPGFETVLRTPFVLAEQVLTDPVARAGVRLTLDGGTLRKPVAGPYEEWTGVLAEQLRRGVRELDVRPPADPDACARFVLSSFTGVQLVAQVPASPGHLPARLQEMWEVLIPGLVHPRRCAHYRDLAARLADRLARSAAVAGPAPATAPVPSPATATVAATTAVAATAVGGGPAWT